MLHALCLLKSAIVLRTPTLGWGGFPVLKFEIRNPKSESRNPTSHIQKRLVTILPAVSCPLLAFYQAFPQGLQDNLWSLAEFSLPFSYVALICEAVVALSPDDQVVQYLDGHYLSC